MDAAATRPFADPPRRTPPALLLVLLVCVAAQSILVGMNRLHLAVDHGGVAVAAGHHDHPDHAATGQHPQTTAAATATSGDGAADNLHPLLHAVPPGSLDNVVPDPFVGTPAVLLSVHAPRPAAMPKPPSYLPALSLRPPIAA